MARFDKVKGMQRIGRTGNDITAGYHKERTGTPFHSNHEQHMMLSQAVALLTW